MAPRETENNAYAKFGVTNKEYYGMLWYFLEWSIWASEESRARTSERAAKPRGFRVSSRVSTFHDIPQMESLLAG